MDQGWRFSDSISGGRMGGYGILAAQIQDHVWGTRA
jgi:hypothetical protein